MILEFQDVIICHNIDRGDSMDINPKAVEPVYQQIAVDVASKIISGHYNIGDKIYARSSLATQYNVSSETARRAICVLEDMNIVKIIKGSGVIITSCENAIKLVKKYNEVKTVTELKDDIFSSMESIEKQNLKLKKMLVKMIEKTDRFKDINPFIPYEITITDKTTHLNKTIGELNFWHNTTATIIGIKRNENLLMSPGPYFTLQKNDILYFVGDDNCVERVNKFLFS